MLIKTMLKKRIKKGGYCILDENFNLNLKEYNPVVVRVIKKESKDFYRVMPISPVVFPIMDDGYALKDWVVHKSFLTPTDHSDRIVVRCPLNMPRFNSEDVEALEKICKILDAGEQSYHNINDMDISKAKVVLHKIKFMRCFDKVNI